MIPDLHIGPFLLSIHGAAIAVGFVVGALVLRRMLAYYDQDPEHADAMVLAAAAGGVIGARLWYVITDWGEFGGNPLGALAVWQGGLVWYGGLIGGILAVALYTRAQRLPAGRIADATPIPLMTGYAIGRAFGDFLRGEEYGKPTGLPWGIKLPYGNPPTTVASLQVNFPWLHVQGNPATVLAVQPTPLYEAIAALAIIGILLALRDRLRTRSGTISGLGLSLYGVERFLVEFLRTNPPVLAGLTAAQLTSLVFIVLGAVIFVTVNRHGRISEASAPMRVSLASGIGDGLERTAGH